MKRWYIIHAYSGYEKQVLRSLTERIQRSAVADSFGDVLVPTEEVVEMKDGKKRKSERKFFPGYVLILSLAILNGVLIFLSQCRRNEYYMFPKK